MKIKTWIPEKLDRELNNYRNLPQHLKRVQVNQACEYYLPEVITRTKRELERDIMREILEVFERHWLEGNQWMVHLLTKSHLICRHIDILSRLRHMVQVELTIICLDEEYRRQLERYAPTVKKRLEVIRCLSNAGVFVRIMAMPFVGTHEEGIRLREVAFNNGARAFKHKGLNYFNVDDLIKGETKKTKRRKDIIDSNLLVKSGEFVTENGHPKTMRLLMPPKGGIKGKWQDNLVETEVEVKRSGYSELNDVDWGYIV
ncbi:MAG: hypothetical protein JRJ57_01190 [Deltaproteobacteria bacterium]|nr:hypothetical protein [Deltaproteobacteria bacterium]